MEINNKTIKISKKEWMQIGKSSGWISEAQYSRSWNSTENKEKVLNKVEEQLKNLNDSIKNECIKICQEVEKEISMSLDFFGNQTNELLDEFHINKNPDKSEEDYDLDIEYYNGITVKLSDLNDQIKALKESISKNEIHSSILEFEEKIKSIYQYFLKLKQDM